MKALPKVLTVRAFEPCNLIMSEVEYEAPLSHRQRSALIKRTKRFCTKYCKRPTRVFLRFHGTTLQVKQYAGWDIPFTKFHFLTLLNQKLGGPVPEAPQEPAAISNQAPTAVSAA